MERGLIAFALFLLVFTVCEYAVYDHLVALGDAKAPPQQKSSNPKSAIDFTLHPLLFTSPKFPVRYSHSDFEEVEFTWGHSNRESNGSFVFEVSEDPSFKTLWVKQETKTSKVTVQFRFPMIVYYRVKDRQGRYSETHRLSLLKSDAPDIALKPSSGRRPILNLNVTPESRATVQIAKDPNFRQIFATRTGVDSNYGFDLPAGKYFARARLEYRQFNRDLTPMVSAWSEARALSIP